jgi:ADP-dependent NAD(P)H-hydrate dehydratase
MPQSRQNKKPQKSSNRKSKISNVAARPITLSARVLRDWPLPQPDREGDKEERGRVLIIGGAAEMPGAVILAATAALRAGAGKLQIATCQSVAQLVAAAVPEARVFALPETKTGAIAASAATGLAERLESVQTVLIGPGMIGESGVARLVKSLLPDIKRAVLVLDAEALAFLSEAPESLAPLGGKAIITPHAGEMANLLSISKESIQRDPLSTAREAAARFNAVVALKGAQTYVAAPGKKTYCNKAGNVGLATSGSGDTLSGIVAGLAARGAEPQQAAAWAVYLHGCAGDRLAKRMGGLGFLARELLIEIPPLMAQLSRR